MILKSMSSTPIGDGNRFSDKIMRQREKTILRITRREALIFGGATVAAGALPAAANTPGQMETAIRRLVGEAEIRKGKVTLDLPPLVENGTPCR